MTYDEIVERVAVEIGQPKQLVDKAYKAYWKAVREHITALPLKEDLTDEEFKALQPNVNIPSIGKLYVTLERYRRVKNNSELIRQSIKEKEKENAAYKED